MNTLSREMLCAIVDGLEAGIILLGEGGRILHWNDWMARRSRIDSSRATHSPIGEILPAIIGTRLEQAIDHALRNSLPSLLSPALHGTLLPLYQTPEDQRLERRMHQLIHVIPLKSGDGAACIIQISDVTANISRERQLREQTEALRRNTTQDVLTGLTNRQTFDELLATEFSGMAGSHRPIALLIADIDSFAAYNSHFGRDEGDRRLAEIAQALSAGLPRGKNMLARYGSDEFALLLPDTEETPACEMAVSLQRIVNDLTIISQTASFPLTICIGVTVMHPDQDSDVHTLLASADVALYQAKSEGKNRAVFFSVEDGSFHACATNRGQ